MFRSYVIAITLTTLVLFTTLYEAAAAADFRQFCQRTSHSSLCIAIIQSDPRANLKTTPNGFCRILADKGIASGTATASKIDNLVERSTGAITGPLRVCDEVYESSLSELKGINFNVANHQSYSSQRSSMHIVLGQGDDCGDAFSQAHIPSPIATENSNYRNIGLTILEILNLNECNRTTDCS